ncbi:ABC transporter permease [Salarchaeum japonicum]|uniref:ABC transporter permease n=1 Tax=Salarchaeum japonicum TaxID=555573 RepID=A0AAV3T0C1_9EURY|nr:ABC transporter permease subunit [Salarchaeum japonicum]
MPSRTPGWLVVARQDVRVARADGSLAWSTAGAALFAVLVAGGIDFLTESAWSAPNTMRLFGPVLLLVVPISVASNCYDAVNGPLQSGRLRIPLSLPVSRHELVAGTALARFVTTAIPVAVLLAVGAAFAVTRAHPIDGLVAAAGILLAGLALTAAFVGVAVGWSAATRTPTRALLGCIGVGGLLLYWWFPVDAARYVLNGFAWPGTLRPDWLSWYPALNPTTAYMDVLRAAGVPVEGAGNLAVALAVLLAWAVVPLALGSARFATVDL